MNKSDKDTENNDVEISSITLQTSPNIDLVISTFEQELFVLVNTYRLSHDLLPLLTDNRLQLAARTHNNLMAQQKILSHQLPGELPFAALGPNNDRLDAVGYNWNYCAENIARGYTTPSAVMAGWIASPGHNANLLSPNARDIGIAYNANGYFWTQDFGRQFV